MDKILERPIFSISILLALCSYLFFFQLGGMALTDPDETFYAQTAKEMLKRAEWHTPYLYDKPQFEKPILFYWLVELSFKLFGVNEFAARFPSALFGLFGVIAIYLLGSLLFNRRVGILAAIILATNVEYIILSRACVTDMVLTTFMLLGILFFFYGYLKEKGYFYLLSSAAFALASLTKGPVAIILPSAVIIVYLFLAKDLKAVKKIPIFSSILVFFVTTLPWYLLMYKLHGMDFIDAFFGFHNITRFLESEHEIGSNPFYNIPILLGGFFPWSAFVPFGFWHMFKKAQSAKRRAQSEGKYLIFVLTWFFVIFAFFSISSTKLPTYIFPSFISLALITAIFWDDFLSLHDRQAGLSANGQEEDASGSTLKGMKFSYYLLLVVIILGTISAIIFINFNYPVILKGAIITGLFFIFGIALSSTAFINKKFIGAFILIVYSAVLFLYLLCKLVTPEIERYVASKEVSQKLSSLMKTDERLGSESNYLAGLAFYAGKIPIDTDKHHILVKFLNSDERVWCVLKEKNHKHLYELDTKPRYTRPSYMVYNVGKRAIITNEMPDDGKYIIKREGKK